MEDRLENASVSASFAFDDKDAQKIIDWYSQLTQFFTWPFIFIVTKLLLDIEFRGVENFREVKNPFVIIANHISFYDSFLFRLALGFWTRHLPLRFMAVEKFQWRALNVLSAIGVIKILYLLFGVFTVLPGLGVERNLKKATDIIKAGGNIVIYPEGKIVPSGDIGSFKQGAAVLYKKTGIPVIPVYFQHTKSSSYRKKIVVIVGTSISTSNSASDQEVTNFFRDSLVRLKLNE